MTPTSLTTKTLLLTLAGALVGCHATAPPATSGTTEPSAEVAVAEPAPPPAPVVYEPEPEPRPTAELLAIPDDCSVKETEHQLEVTCPEGGLVARWAPEPAPEDRLDSWTVETMRYFKDNGIPMVLLGEPTCTVQGESVPCTRVLGRSSDGVESTAFLAVGASPDGGSVEVSCHWTRMGDEDTYQHLCQQVLRRI